LGLCLGWAPPGLVAAEPSIWAEARNPRLRSTALTLAEVDELLSKYRRFSAEERRLSLESTFLLRRARELLEQAEAADSSNPRLWIRLAEVLYETNGTEGNRELLVRAARLFRRAAEAPLPPSDRAESLNDLAICYARLADHRQETLAYAQALALEPHAESRAVLLANQAEGLMALGEIGAAIRGYRRSLATTPDYAMILYGPTTLWGLAVALDRSGDLHGALEQVRMARAYDPDDRRLRSPTWFFLPPHDESWYAALGHWFEARASAERDDRLRAYHNAIQAWAAYLDRAPRGDRWAPLAAQRQRQCERELRQLLAGSDG